MAMNADKSRPHFINGPDSAGSARGEGRGRRNYLHRLRRRGKSAGRRGDRSLARSSPPVRPSPSALWRHPSIAQSLPLPSVELPTCGGGDGGGSSASACSFLRSQETMCQ